MSFYTWFSNDKTIWDYPPEIRNKYLIGLGIFILVILASVEIYCAIKHFREKREGKAWKKYHKDN